jgi:hypothetical protein
MRRGACWHLGATSRSQHYRGETVGADAGHPTDIPSSPTMPDMSGPGVAPTVENARVFRWWDDLCFGLLTALTWAVLARLMAPWCAMWIGRSSRCSWDC